MRCVRLFPSFRNAPFHSAGNIYSNLRKVFTIARELKITTGAAADRIAEERLAQGARVTPEFSREGILTNPQTTWARAALATAHV
jgi:hypothetical protein